MKIRHFLYLIPSAAMAYCLALVSPGGIDSYVDLIGGGVVTVLFFIIFIILSTDIEF